jgi:hypothetical protein
VIVAILSWAPIKLAKYGLRLLFGTEESLDNLAILTNQAIDDYMKENPL